MPILRLLLAMLLGLLCATPATAASIEVAPVVHELAAGRTALAMTVTNRSEESLTLQLRAFRWFQRDGQDVLEPAPELVVAPAIFELAAGRAQVVRALLRLPAEAAVASAEKAVERSYRFLLDELPGAPVMGQVRMALRISMPLFARIPTPEAPQIGWRVDPADGSVVATNSGGTRDRLRELALVNADGRRLPLPAGANPYLLAGAERRWPLGDARQSLRDGQKLSVSVLTDSGRIEVPLALAP